MSSLIQLQQVQDFAQQAHEGQRRKFADEPYIRHPERVMDICRTVTDRLPILAAALLHDVLEDTAVTPSRMREFLGDVFMASEAEETFRLVVALTDVYTKAAYPEWNRRVRRDHETERLAETSADAQTIKYADILDNARDVLAAGSEFALKLLKEYRTLLNKMEKGDPVLRTKAITAVNEAMQVVN